MGHAELTKGFCVLRILHVLDHSLPMHSGYTFRTRAILKAQIEQGWAVAGVTGLRHSAGGAPEALEDGLTFFRTPEKNLLPSPIGEYQEINALAARLEGVVDQWKPDILHAHSPVMNALAALRVGKRRGLPVVYEIRAFWEDAAVNHGL